MDRNRPLIGITAYEVPASFSHWLDMPAVMGPAVEVHSCHHQAPDRIGEGLAVTARAPDGVVEGVELVGARFCIGVLWHPEEHAEHGGPLFQGLVAAAQPAAVGG